MARYADLKRERDDAVARAVEAERYSMRSEIERIEAECAAKVDQAERERDHAYVRLYEVSTAATTLAENMTSEIRALVELIRLERQEKSEG